MKCWQEAQRKQRLLPGGRGDAGRADSPMWWLLPFYDRCRPVTACCFGGSRIDYFYRALAPYFPVHMTTLALLVLSIQPNANCTAAQQENPVFKIVAEIMVSILSVCSWSINHKAGAFHRRFIAVRQNFYIKTVFFFSEECWQWWLVCRAGRQPSLLAGRPLLMKPYHAP
jgi:hypothetical protein